MIHNADYVMSKLISTTFAEKAQVGVDLTVKSISEIKGTLVVLADNSPVADVIPPQKTVYQELSYTEEGLYQLDVGVYSIEFNEGLQELSPSETAFILQRSTFNRAGVIIRGSVYDPGFRTENLGATMYVLKSGIFVQKNARVAQLLIAENHPTTNTYSGQYQGL